ncbi:nascent polypeptide-associated complex protein [Candidatus Alkanophaga liquidiphilum]|nr:Transcription factor homologous to NACalpha-BTF3 [Candidatus Alkanophaga liquidiphilum]RLG36200.1 MAG: nascent polypeptide-associated complex protein [Candidatus Alkanophagales archaeon]
MRGMRGVSPKKLKQMMQQLGINVEELDDVEEVVIRRADVELVFRDANVTVVNAPGAKTYQIVGTPEERPRVTEDVVFSEEDVNLVMEKAGCSEAEARAALQDAKGDLAEAIMRLCGD